MFKKAEWIWAVNSLEVDDYARFLSEFESTSSQYILRLACDSTYAIYLDGTLIKFMECSDYPDNKYVDEVILDLTEGHHELVIDVWHFGIPSQKYVNSNHGLIFELCLNEEIICFSSENTQSRVLNEFENGYKLIIGSQQGATFKYDFTRIPCQFGKSILVDKTNVFSFREINNIDLLDRIEVETTKLENSILIDMKEETSGIPDVDFESPCEQLVRIFFGEHILFGGVVRGNEEKNYVFEYYAKKGHNKLLNPLKRFGARYLEVESKEPLKINYIGLRPVLYHHNVIRRDFKDELINKIYDTCIHTLECCMHEHYEDCPWREQCLYSLDSRNQMLCGYYCFEGFEYPKHNMLLLAKSMTKDGLLSICSPTDKDLPIPSFSLIYFQTVSEYLDYTNDRSVLAELKPVLDKILETFNSKVETNGLVRHFGNPYWNFYEWSEDSYFGEEVVHVYKHEGTYDLILNCMYVMAVNYYNKIFGTNIDTSKTKEAIKEKFFDKERGVFVLTSDNNKYSQLGNCLACIIGLGSNELIEKILHDEKMITATLSMRSYLYDALLAVSPDYKDYIIEDIKIRYKKMLDAGATTFWETEVGALDGTGGSLCHGWSALPVYYLSKFVPNSHK